MRRVNVINSDDLLRLVAICGRFVASRKWVVYALLGLGLGMTAGDVEAAVLSSETINGSSGGGTGESAAYKVADDGFFKDLGVRSRPGRLNGGDLTLESPALSDPVLFMPGIHRRLRPEDANVKIGDFYFDLLSVSGSVLNTDNVHLTPNDQESRTIGVLRLSAAAYYQITEQLQFGVAGRLVYLPRDGRLGVAGFGIDDPLYAFTYLPIFLAEIRYEARLDEWELEFFNRFAVRAAPATADELGFEFEEEDRAGRHVYRDPFRTRGASDPFLVRINRTGASADRLLATETRLTLGVSRTYWWYDNVGERFRILPEQRDRASVSLRSERENLRFKPFASYQADRYDSSQWTHRVRGGAEGPLSDYLTLRGEYGYFWADDFNRQGRLWAIRLRHTPGPLTFHQISYSQFLREHIRDLERTWAYLIRHNLNSTMSVSGNVRTTRFEFLDRPDTKGSEWGVYAGLNAAVIADGGIGLRGGYEERHFDDRLFGERKSWVGRAGIRHRSIQADLHYRYTDREAPLRNIDYEEHVVMFTLTKFFD